MGLEEPTDRARRLVDHIDMAMLNMVMLNMVMLNMVLLNMVMLNMVLPRDVLPASSHELYTGKCSSTDNGFIDLIVRENALYISWGAERKVRKIIDHTYRANCAEYTQPHLVVGVFLAMPYHIDVFGLI